MADASRIHPDDRDLLFGTSDLRVGDAVVHFDHGLARFAGREVSTLGDVDQTLVSLEYRHGGILLLPAVEGIDFWRYGARADDLTLDRLKADDWVKRRDEMVAELRAGADALVAAAARRQEQRACAISHDTDGYRAFVAACPFDLTDGQARATRDVLADMACETPMDRLVIGDVGFGKTEVALRAMAAAALAGHQVALVAPTTVLARQHFETLTARFTDLDLRVAEVSRLTGPDARADALEGIADGSVRVVVGTHALLGDNVAFSDLALVVVDEEQKFGAAQKDDLRALSRGAHVLNMTATPIPRSLAAADVGLLGVSVVATPPPGRKPVQTRVAPRKKRAVIEAVNDEVARGGQAYVVCPRIKNVKRLKKHLDRQDRRFSYAVAHGKMSQDDLEDVMLRFMHGEVDVLLTTAIIESGLDNARANAMVVWNADRFGLSQLHQLRGRIGRADVAAHMTLLSDVDFDEDSDAAARLAAFADLSHVGAGFDIARADRDMRGFGKLEGDAQSGHVSRLGIGLYRHIIREQVDLRQREADTG